jgi:hypothetical protein
MQNSGPHICNRVKLVFIHLISPMLKEILYCTSLGYRTLGNNSDREDNFDRTVLEELDFQQLLNEERI